MNEIHPTAIIGPDVELGRDNVIGPFAVLTGPVRLGDSTWLGAGVVIGAPPEVRSFDHRTEAVGHEPAGVHIGSGNRIREYAQIHQGWKQTTRIGDDTFIMNQSYVAHDGVLGDGVTLASSCLLAGHVRIGDGANLGLGVAVHQFSSIGAGAMIGMGAVVTRDIPAFAMAYGNPARVRGANRVGLRRLGVAEEPIAQIHSAYENGDLALDLAAAELPQTVRERLISLTLQPGRDDG